MNNISLADLQSNNDDELFHTLAVARSFVTSSSAEPVSAHQPWSISPSFAPLFSTPRAQTDAVSLPMSQAVLQASSSTPRSTQSGVKTPRSLLSQPSSSGTGHVCKNLPWPIVYKFPLDRLSADMQKIINEKRDLRKPVNRFYRGLLVRTLITDVFDNYCLYPDTEHKQAMALSIITAFPHLRETNCTNGFGAWLATIIDCMKNKHREMKDVFEVLLHATGKRKRENEEQISVSKDAKKTSKKDVNKSSIVNAETKKAEGESISKELDTASTNSETNDDVAMGVSESTPKVSKRPEISEDIAAISVNESLSKRSTHPETSQDVAMIRVDESAPRAGKRKVLETLLFDINPDIEEGEDEVSNDSMKKLMKKMMQRVEKDRNDAQLQSMMRRTYAFRRTMINDGCSIAAMYDNYPALFTTDGLVGDFEQLCKKKNVLKTVRTNLDSLAPSLIRMARKGIKGKVKASTTYLKMVQELDEANSDKDKNAQNLRIAALSLLPVLLSDDAGLLYTQFEVKRFPRIKELFADFLV